MLRAQSRSSPPHMGWPTLSCAWVGRGSSPFPFRLLMPCFHLLALALHLTAHRAKLAVAGHVQAPRCQTELVDRAASYSSTHSTTQHPPSSAASASAWCLMSLATTRCPPGQLTPPQPSPRLTVPLHPQELHWRPVVHAAGNLLLLPKFATTTHHCWWGPSPSDSSNRSPNAPAWMSTRYPPAAGHWLARFCRWTTTGERGKASPIFLQPWAERPVGPGSSCRWGPVAQCHFTFSIWVNSIQILNLV
jgi:hypothetical protein